MSATFDALMSGYVIEDPNGYQRVRGTVALIRSGRWCWWPTQA